MRTIRILAIDDHEMTMLGYKFILERVSVEELNIVVDMARSYDEGKEKIIDSVSSFLYDIIFMDVQLFPPDAKRKESGEDLGMLAREIAPDSKVVFMSSFGDNYRINSIMKTVDPDGYLVKSDIDPPTLEAAVLTVMDNPPYYSAKALDAIRKQLSTTIVLDEKDKNILYHLSIGTKTKDLEKFIKLSSSSIENRKRQLKSIFGIESKNDLALIEAAREKGFI